MTSDKIGRYEIVKEIARGGMAIVYLARDTFMERLVAVKVLPRVFMHDPQFEKRFTREARVVASLEHPAIVPVYDFGYHGDQPFMVYRYMSGGTLKDKIQREGAKSLEQTYEFISRITPAIDKAHDNGIIHRDLKPSNILFDDDNKAYVADFGIAKIVESTSHLTGNAIVGTPAYMSPEQFTGDVEVGRYSDIYALGIILYELLSGELPFKADTTPRLMKLHIMDPVPSIRGIRAELPQDIDALLEKALAKSAPERYQRVEDLRTEFQAIFLRLSTIREAVDDETLGEDPTIVEPEVIPTRGETTIEPVDQVLAVQPLGVDSTPPVVISELRESTAEDEVSGFKLPQISMPDVVINLKEILQYKAFLAALMGALGWLVGHLIGSYFMSTDSTIVLGTVFIFVGVIGGISLALALKWLVPNLGWLRFLFIVIGWIGSWGLLWSLGEVLAIPASWDLDYLVLQVLLSALGGCITGLSLFWNHKQEWLRNTAVLLSGWGVAALLGIMFNAYINAQGWFRFYYVINEFITIDGPLSYAIIGAIGTSITVWQVKKSSLMDAPFDKLDYTDTIRYLWRKDRIVLVLILSAWLIGEVVRQIIFDLMSGDTSLIFLTYGGVGAFFTGLAIKRLKPSVGWKRIIYVVVIWMVLWEGRYYLASLFDHPPGLSGGWYMIRLLAAAVAGFLTGIVLKDTFASTDWKMLVRLSLGWVLGWGVAMAISGYFVSVGYWTVLWETPIAEFYYFWLLTSPIVGLIGGVTMIREMLNAERL